MRTPLRYPGGKTRFSDFFSQVMGEEEINKPLFVEPYCGGAGAAIKLLLNNKVHKIYINDKDRSIYAFWYSILKDTEKFIRKIQNTEITLKEFDRQKKNQKNKKDIDLFDLGFSTFFINRTAFSGILTGGPLGGRHQKGDYKIDCRFEKEELIKRIKLIAKRGKNIRIFNKDAVDFLNLKTIKKLPKNRTIFYIDPPYFEKGGFLYENNYQKKDHEKLEKILRKRNGNFFISYDDVKEIREIYSSWKIEKKIIPYSAGQHKSGLEIIITNN